MNYYFTDTSIKKKGKRYYTIRLYQSIGNELKYIGEEEYIIGLGKGDYAVCLDILLACGHITQEERSRSESGCQGPGYYRYKDSPFSLKKIF